MNHLNHFQEFQEVLSHYRMSEHAKEVLQQLNLVLLVGPSSAGRNTIIRKLTDKGDYHFVVSDTTRQKRTNNGVLEQNGIEYWFRREEEMLEDLRQGEFLEAALIHQQQVSGISIRELERIKKNHKIAINEVNFTGAENIYKAKPDTKIFFVVPPDFDSWMARAHGRGELPADEVWRRLQESKKEFAHALEHDFYLYLVNDNLGDAVAQIDATVKTGEYDPIKNQQAKETIETLLMATERYLEKTALN